MEWISVGFLPLLRPCLHFLSLTDLDPLRVLFFPHTSRWDALPSPTPHVPQGPSAGRALLAPHRESFCCISPSLVLSSHLWCSWHWTSPRNYICASHLGAMSKGPCSPGSSLWLPGLWRLFWFSKSSSGNLMPPAVTSLAPVHFPRLFFLFIRDVSTWLTVFFLAWLFCHPRR